MEPKVRIAQIDLICAQCGKKIGQGHPYVWRHRDIKHPCKGVITLVERVHPECMEH